MSAEDRLRRYLLIGAVIGGVISLSISLLMDTLFSDSLNGTWRDAIVADLGNFFRMHTTPESFLVYLIFGVILLVLTGFGAFMGIIFTFFISRFLSFLKG